MATDNEAPAAPRSSLLYAMGKLTATVESHSDTLKDLPDQVAQRVLPRVVILEDSVSKLSARMTSVEKRQWLVAGGFSAAVLLAIKGPNQ